MSQIIDAIKSLFSKIDHAKIYIDNLGFRIHYKATATLLVLFGLLVTSSQYFGDPIDCIVDNPTREKIADKFCWIHGTYTQLGVTKSERGQYQINYKKVQTQEDDLTYLLNTKLDKEHPLQKEFFNYRHGDPETRVFHTYYQWVWCFLFLEAFLFYIPHWLWKNWEGGRMRVFVAHLKSFVLSEDDRRKDQDAVVSYFCNQGVNTGRATFFKWKFEGRHNIYAFQYIFCELLNFANILLQIILLDRFFDGELSRYGFKMWNMSSSRPYARNDYMTKIFPIITMCEIPVYGITGSLVPNPAVCVLPINILNEKIFIFTWFWFIFVLIITIVSILYRIITLIPSSQIRSQIILRLNRSMSPSTVAVLVSRMQFGDWFFLYLLGKNINPMYYAELLEAIAKKLDGPDYETADTIEAWGPDGMKRKRSISGP